MIFDLAAKVHFFLGLTKAKRLHEGKTIVFKANHSQRVLPPRIILENLRTIFPLHDLFKREKLRQLPKAFQNYLARTFHYQQQKVRAIFTSSATFYTQNQESKSETSEILPKTSEIFPKTSEFFWIFLGHFLTNLGENRDNHGLICNLPLNPSPSSDTIPETNQQRGKVISDKRN